MDYARADQRQALHLRPMACELGSLRRADGSVRFGQGDTLVIAGVYGPTEVSAREEKIDSAALKVTFVRAGGRATPADLAISEAVREALEPVVLTHMHPRTAVIVQLQLVRDAGSLLAAAINAAVLALVDAGLPMCSLLGAVHLAVLADGLVLTDPTTDEQASSVCQLTLAFADEMDAIVCVHSLGRLEASLLHTQLAPLGRAAARAVTAFFRLTIERRSA